MKIVAIIQARMTSSRLPGKVLQCLAGEPMLARVVHRCQQAHRLHEVIVATSDQASDDAIVALCQTRGWPWFRGSCDDVLDRYYNASYNVQADVIVRITSDCPLIEPQIINRLVSELVSDHAYDYVSNTLPPRTFPRGLDCEVFTFETLARAWSEDTNPAWREHVTPYIYRHPEYFRLQMVMHETNLSAMRWTVDTAKDMAFVQCIYNYFGHDRFSWQDVLALLEEHPEWQELNRDVVQKHV